MFDSMFPYFLKSLCKVILTRKWFICITVVSTACHNRCERTALKVLHKYDIIIKHISKQIADVVINIRPKDSIIQNIFIAHSYIKKYLESEKLGIFKSFHSNSTT